MFLLGNKPLLPHVKESPSKKSKGKKDSDTVNMVMYKGAMLDIPSMVQRLEKSEKLKRDTDTKLRDLQEEMGEYFKMLPSISEIQEKRLSQPKDRGIRPITKNSESCGEL